MEKIYDADQIQSVYMDAVPAIEYDEQKKELNLLRMGIIVTHLCTLRCKLCAERTAYYEKPYNPKLNELKNEIDALFRLVDYTMKFEVTGGEPTIRKDLPEVLDYLFQYRLQFGRVRLITNGSILFSAELIHALKRYGRQVDVLIDNYGENLSGFAKKNADLLAENGVLYILRDQRESDHFGGWVDFGDTSRKHTDEEARRLFHECIISKKVGFSLRVRGGLLSSCAMTLQCIEFGSDPGDPREYIDLFDNSMTKHEQCLKLLCIFGADKLSACAYCNGFCEDSKRFRPAEQLERGACEQSSRHFDSCLQCGKNHSSCH